MAPIRLLILSDTHDTAFPSREDILPLHHTFNPNSPEKKIDVLLHCGDLTMIGGLSNYRRAISNLLSIPAELRLIIPGNHDVSLDRKWWSENLIEGEDDPAESDKALKLFDDAAKDGGLVLLNEGTHRFTLQDGRTFKIYASPYTPEYGGYAFAYGPEEDRFNAGSGRIPDRDVEEIDIIMTHGPPAFPFPNEKEETNPGYKLDLGRKEEHCGCDKLFRAVERARPLIHCFGHIHEGYGSQVVDWERRDVSYASGVEGERKGDKLPVIKVCAGDRWKKTTFINAAIMRHGEEEEEGNNPWIVELEL